MMSTLDWLLILTLSINTLLAIEAARRELRKP